VASSWVQLQTETQALELVGVRKRTLQPDRKTVLARRGSE